MKKDKFQLQKLILRGKEYQRTIEFDENLTIIKGDGFSGKSVVLNLISYLLGGNTDLIDLSVQKELSSHCDEVFLQYVIDNAVYTNRRSLKVDKNQISIFLCAFDECEEYSPWKKSADDTCEFIAEKLGIKLHSILKRKAGSKDLTEEKISFRDIMRFVYMKQNELGTTNYMQWNNTFVSGKNKEVFKIINDLVIPDLEDIEGQIVRLQNELNQLKNINGGMIDYLSKRDAAALVMLSDQREKIAIQIQNYSSEKADLINNHKQTSSSKVYTLLNDDIYKISMEINDLNSKKGDLELSQKNKMILQEEYSEENQKLLATLEAMKKIKITEHSEHCPLCNSLIKIVYDENNVEDIEIAVKQLQDKLKTLEDLIKQDRIKLEKVEHKIKQSLEKRTIYENALSEYKNNIEVPYLSEIESYNSLIKDLTLEKNKITSLIDIHKEITSNDLRINEIDKELKELKKQKNELQKLETREKEVLEKINTKYRLLMRRFKFTEESCYVNEETFQPYYSGNSIIKHTSGSLLLCMGVAYLGALIECSLEDELNCKPPVVMIDTVANNIGTNIADKDSVDPQTYQEIYKYIYDLSKAQQIIIVDNTPPETELSKKEYLFKRRATAKDPLIGLIDDSKNEMKV